MRQPRHSFNAMKKSTPVIALLIAAAAALTGCGTSRSSQATAPRQKAPAYHAPANTSTSDPLAALAAETLSWENVSLPAKITVTAPSKAGISARVTMVRDRSVDVSVRILGFEVAYLIADTDSVHAYIKPNKTYVSESLDRFFGSDGYSLANVQDLVLGRIFYPGQASGNPAYNKLFSLEQLDQMVIATPRRQTGEAAFGFVINATDANLVSTAVTAGGHEGVAYYSDITLTPAGKTAGQCEVDIDGGRMAATVDWNLSDAKWNASKVRPRQWSVPRGAKRITLSSSLLKSLAGVI